MKDVGDTAGAHQGQQERTSYPAKRAACKANAFESWLISYQGRLAAACAHGTDCVDTARGDKEAELQPEREATADTEPSLNIQRQHHRR